MISNTSNFLQCRQIITYCQLKLDVSNWLRVRMTPSTSARWLRVPWQDFKWIYIPPTSGLRQWYRLIPTATHLGEIIFWDLTLGSFWCSLPSHVFRNDGDDPIWKAVLVQSVHPLKKQYHWVCLVLREAAPLRGPCYHKMDSWTTKQEKSFNQKACCHILASSRSCPPQEDVA